MNCECEYDELKLRKNVKALKKGGFMLVGNLYLLQNLHIYIL